MAVRTERLVTLEWTVRERHAATFTPEGWAELMSFCRQPDGTDSETLDRVADWMDTRDGRAWLSELATTNNWIDSEEDGSELFDLSYGNVDVVS